MAFASLTHALSILAANDETFVDKDLLYVAGGLLVVSALVFSFVGMRKKDFPSSSQLKIVVGWFVVLVLVTGFGALQTARFEQAHRRAENQEAAKESQAENVQNQQSLDESGAGEADTPGSGAGEPQSNAGGGGAGDVEAGRTLFADNGCGSCHTLSDAGATGEVGPNLDEAVPTLTAAEVKTSIVDPSAVVAKGFPDGTMPQTYGEQLDDSQIQALVDYLTTVTNKG